MHENLAATGERGMVSVPSSPAIEAETAEQEDQKEDDQYRIRVHLFALPELDPRCAPDRMRLPLLDVFLFGVSPWTRERQTVPATFCHALAGAARLALCAAAVWPPRELLLRVRGFLQHILRASNGVLNRAFSFPVPAFNDKLGVAKRLAGGFLDAARGLFGGAGDAILVHVHGSCLSMPA